MSLKTLLFPDPPRGFAGRRATKIVLRAGHVLCAGTYLGAFVFGVEPVSRQPWFWALLASGCLLLALDLHETGAFLLETRGLAVLGKVVLLALLPCFGAAQVWVLVFLLLASVLSSHAPASVRHRVVVSGIRGSQTRG
ncbi:MAG: hypothetical protein ACYTDU_02905 [Planctomycetota bacterium]|jgi:hypothetical protein